MLIEDQPIGPLLLWFPLNTMSLCLVGRQLQKTLALLRSTFSGYLTVTNTRCFESTGDQKTLIAVGGLNGRGGLQHLPWRPFLRS